MITVNTLVELGLDRDAATTAESILAKTSDKTEAWRRLSKEVLTPTVPFEVHRTLFEETYATWEPGQGPPPVWVPSSEEIQATNLARLMDGDSYESVYRASLDNPESFWRRMLKELGVQARTPFHCVLDLTEGVEHPKWFPGMTLNIAESCFLERDPNSCAIVWQDEGGDISRMSVRELEQYCHHVAQALEASGFEAGDAIAIDMPMTVESVVIYLAVVMAGCAVVSIADSFAPVEIEKRLRIADAKGIFTQDVILRGGKTLPLYERVKEANAPRTIVLPATGALQVSLREGDLSFDDFLATTTGNVVYSPRAGAVTDTTNILFSSGTTGDPKAIPWTHLTPIKAAADGFIHHDIQQGDVVVWPTNLGWMMGPWLIYASLLNGATIGLFQGTPGNRSFGTFVQDVGVTMLGVVPSLVKSWKASGCMDGLDWSSIRCYSSTGEASSPEEMHWLVAQGGYKPVMEYCGGTEIGGGYVTGTQVQPQALSAFSTPAIGCGFLIIDEEGQPTDNGELALLPPMLGSSQTLLNRDHHEVYFEDMPKGPRGEHLRRHGDQVLHLGGGYYRALGRVDDTMNLGGIKTSSAEIERVCNQLDGVLETAAIAVPPAGGGPSQLLLCTVADGPADADALRDGFQQAIRSELNPLFKVARVVLLDSLPRTASNKVMRRVLRREHGG